MPRKRGQSSGPAAAVRIIWVRRSEGGHIAQAAASVVRACGELGRAEARVELAAEELRTALRQLDFLVGRVDVEAVLDVIFGTFCLGK